MAPFTALVLLAALVPVSANAVFVLAITSVAATALSAPAHYYITRNLDVFDPKYIFSLHADVSSNS
ncbi:hypothetical protein [Mucilaginibacter sp. PAMB04168]|uniref:hypothetical protein n=1 Tax=Mucilaginibacter sp. PAMB04168 TaxID=3138567 RepID=UPI0031F69B80